MIDYQWQLALLCAYLPWERSRMAVKPHSSPKNRIPLTFGQAIDVLLAVDPKKLPPVVRPGKTKAKKAKNRRGPSKKKG